MVVVNASAGLDWKALRGLRLPALGELLTLLQDKSVLYDNGNSLRRQELVARFELAERDGEGCAAPLSTSPRAPSWCLSSLRGREGADGALTVSRRLGPCGARGAADEQGVHAEADWATIAKANAAVATTLVKFDLERRRGCFTTPTCWRW